MSVQGTGLAGKPRGRPGMDRRRFLVTSLAGALAVRRASEAQQTGKTPRIGVLTGLLPSHSYWVAFRDALRELGYVEGRNIVFKYQVYRLEDHDHARTSAIDLVAAGVDVIVPGHANVAVLAAKNATTTIPIVMAGAIQVVETGFVQSFARPGTNVTGLTWDVSTTEGTKRLELFKRLVLSLSRLANVWDPKDPGTAAFWPDFRSGAKALGITVDSVPVSDKPGLERALCN